MKIKVNGDFLELQHVSLQFQKKNMLMSFGTIEADRTMSFDIPATIKNNTILELSNDFHTYGTAMRAKKTCYIQDGLLAVQGELHITEYDCKAKSYKAVISFGSKQSLKILTENGTIRETMEYLGITATWDGTCSDPEVNDLFKTYIYASLRTTPPVYNIRQAAPSIWIAELLRQYASQYGITYAGGNAQSELLRIVNNHPKDFDGRMYTFGEEVELHPNLPDLTFYELLQIVAACCGQLIYVEGTTISLIDADDWNTWQTEDLTGKVIELESVTRNVADWGSHNIIPFRVGWYPDGDLNAEGKIDYVIDNSSLESENVIGEIKEYHITDTYDIIGGLEYAACFSIDNSYFPALTNDFMFIVSHYTEGDELIDRLSPVFPIAEGEFMPPNAFISALCSSSTTIRLTAKMSLLEFNNMKPEMLFYWNATKWAWIDVKWDDGVAALTLAKIV